MTSASPQRSSRMVSYRRSADRVTDRYMRAVRRRLAARWFLAGVLLAGFAALGLVLTWMARDPDQRAMPLGWLLAWVAGGVSALGLVGGLVRLAWRSSTVVIRRLRQVDEPLAEDLWSALELRDHDRGSSTERAFVGCHGASVAQRLLLVPPGELVGFERLRQSAWMLLLGVVLTATAVATLPGAAPRLLAALGAEGGTDRMPRVLRGAGVENVRLVIHPPRYTGLPMEVVTPGKAPVSVVPGSRVTVVAKAPAALRAAGALIPGGAVVSGTLLGERIFRVEVVVRQRGRVVFVYVTTDGVRHVGATGPSLQLRTDLPPDLAVQPGDERIDLPKPKVLPLQYEITDDFGLLEARLVWKTDLGDEGAFLLGRGPRFGPGRKQRIAGVLKWDLTRLRLRRGQSVRFHLEARDNRSGGGPAVAEPGPQKRRSRVQTITIVGKVSARLKILARLRRLLERSVRRLADRLEHDARRPCKKRLAAWKQARGAESRLAGDTAALILRVSKAKGIPTLLRAAVVGPLAKTLARLRVALKADRKKAGAGAKTEPCARVNPLASSGQEVIRKLEALVLALDRLIGRATLEQMQRLGQRIAALQKEIEQLQAELKKNPSAELRRRIARRVKELERLFERLGHLWSTLQDDALDQHVNRYAMDRKGTRKLLKRMAKKMGKGKPSGSELDQLKRRVNRLMKALNQGLDRFRKYYPLPGERGLQRDLQSVRQLSRAQDRVNRQRAGQPGSAQGQQRRLSRQARNLGRSLKRRPGRQGVARMLDDAARLMRQAAKGDGKAAAEKGRAAKKTLDRAAKALDRQGRVTKGDGEEGRNGTRSKEVDIPPAGGALPRKLRQRILEGGRTAWPEGYRQPLKRYYERLLR